jgi:general secretion pathway protein E/type IV pilus assembly protein PilB
MEDLGFSEANTRCLENLLRRPEGIVVITGPTGSGKTTTLYAMLQQINSAEINVMTLEDPVEYELPLIRQSQIREAAGMTFGDGVRSILRQDPDVVFIGEVRDEDTAAMALRAAMSGHQVFTTLHTNDALGAIPRLLDLGLNPSMLSGHMICVMAQRLVRLLCDHCKRARPASEDECRLLGADSAEPPTIHEAVGCEWCGNKGYRGRIAVAEILGFNNAMDELVARAASRVDLLACARERGFATMADDGIAKVLDGLISVDELVKHVDMTDRLD